MFNFTGVGQTSDPRRFTGDFNVLVEDNPSGSTLVLEYSRDNGVTWKALPRAGSDITFAVRDSVLIEMRQSFTYRLRCSVYGGTPFIAGLLGSR
ncbi:MAG: hypothetical protein EB060_12510 [Proteobacteria bacterium]|nr:hypothetical protein [Pseudomonadota bacterium]